MRPLSKRHAAILDQLTAGVSDDDPHRRIDNAPGTFMAAVVEKIGPARYSVAHYFVQNGDLVADPDVEFVKHDGAWFPAAITQVLGYSRPLETDDEGRIVSCRPRAYADLRSFAGILLTNIKHQQGDLSPQPAAGEEGGETTGA